MNWLWSRAPVEDPGEDYRYAITIDAGSSGSRLEIYSWLDHDIARVQSNATQLASLPVIQINGKQKKVRPGIASFADNPSKVGEDHLAPLFKYALKHIPKSHQSSTPIFLQATAGMRLLSTAQQTAILSSACAYTRQHTPFIVSDCDAHFQVIDGVTEGMYGWISINYLLGAFDRPDLHDHGKGHYTYGFVDMGGASAQVAFAPNQTEIERHAEDLLLLRLRTLDGLDKEYRVFVSTWLGYGVQQARNRYVQELLKQSTSNDQIIADPCIPKGLQLPVENSKSVLLGTGSLSQCLSYQIPLLGKDFDCHDDPCLFGGVHAPAIDFDVNHFIGVSEYWHLTNDIFDMGGTYDYATYSSKVEQFCSRDWDSIEDDIKREKYKLEVDRAQLTCFKAAWMMNVLHDGFGVPRISREFDSPSSGTHNSTTDLIEGAKSHGFVDPFQSVDKIGDVEVSWTLGKMVLYVSSTLPSVNRGTEVDATSMVGFGPNNDRLYIDGEFYAPSGSVVPIAAGALSQLMGRRIPGYLLFFTMICVAIWLIMGKERRNRVLASTTRKWFRRKRKVMGATGIYERLEAGEGEADDPDEEIGGRAWALQELKPPKSQQNGVSGSASGSASPRGGPSPRFEGAINAAASSIIRSASRERLPSRPTSRAEYHGRR